MSWLVKKSDYYKKTVEKDENENEKAVIRASKSYPLGCDKFERVNANQKRKKREASFNIIGSLFDLAR